MAKRKTVTIGGHQYYKKQLTRPDGKRVALYGKTLGELREKEAALRETFAATKNDHGVTFREYAELQLSFIKQQVEPSTYVGYEEKVRLHMIPLLGDKLMADITSDDIQSVLVTLVPLSQSYYRTSHMLLRRIFKAAKKSRLIQIDPTEDMSGVGGKKKKERPALTDEEVNILLETIVGLPVETFCRLGIYAGLRREEILGLKWEYVFLDAETPYIAVENAWRLIHNRPEVSSRLKSDAARRKIPIPPQLVNHLREKRKTSLSAYVICNKDGEPLTGTQWKNLWKQLTRRIAIPRKYTRYKDGKKEVHWVTPELGDHAAHNPDVVYGLAFSVTPHQLRYTYVTNLIYRGLDPKTVQYLAGHESIKVTMEVYARLKYNRPADLAGPINNAFSEHEKGSGEKS